MPIESAADRSVFLTVDDFGITATYTPVVGSAVSVNGIFDSGYEEVRLPGAIDVSLALSRSRMVVRTADLPSAAADGDTVTIESVNYVVKILAADGEGITELIMARAIVAKVMAGAIDGVGDVAILMTITRIMAGAIEGAGDVAAAMTAVRVAAGAIDGAGDVAGDFTLGGDLDMAGAIEGAGDVAAVMTATRIMAGAIEGVGDVAAAMTAVRAFAGAIEGSGDAVAAMTAVRAMAGAIGGVGDVAGAFTLGAFSEQAVTFDGSNDGLRRSSNMSGAADNKKGLIFASVDFTNVYTEDSADEAIIAQNASDNMLRRRGDTGVFRLVWRNTTPALVIVLNGSTVIGAERANILISMDADGTSRMYVWTSGGGWNSEASDAGGGGVNLEFTAGSIAVCRRDTGSVSDPFDGDVYRVALWIGQAPDITSSAVQDKFCNSSTGVLVDPATAEAAYGEPILHYGDAAAAVWNAGTNGGSGGDFTMAGSVVDV